MKFLFMECTKPSKAFKASLEISRIINNSKKSEFSYDLTYIEDPIYFLACNINDGKTIYLKANKIGDVFAFNCGADVYVEANEICGRFFINSSGNLEIKSNFIKGLCGVNSTGIIKINNLIFTNNTYDTEIYPDMSNILPLKFAGSLLEVNYNLELLKKKYVHLYKEAIKFYQMFNIDISMPSPKFYVSDLINDAGAFIRTTKTIHLDPFNAYNYFDYVIFHEMSHYILDKHIYDNPTKEKIVDSFTYYYFHNISKERCNLPKFDDPLVSELFTFF